MCAEVWALLRARDTAFKLRDSAAYRLARWNLSHGIREAKRRHGQKIHSHFTNTRDTWRLWQGFNSSDCKPCSPQICLNNPTLPDELSHFFAQFEASNTTQIQRPPPSPGDQLLQLSTAGVRKALASVNPRKAAGPDNVLGRVLKNCAGQLKDVLTDIFNTPLHASKRPPSSLCHRSTIWSA